MSDGAEDANFKQTDKGELLTLMLAYVPIFQDRNFQFAGQY